MSSGLVAFVDESGDEGFVFRPDGSGSSRWFVISAVVMRKSDGQQLVACLKTVRSILRKEPQTPLHFVKLSHEQRIPYVKHIGNLPIQIISVIVHKPSLSNPGYFRAEKDSLYRYLTRFLIERISWICRDAYKPNDDPAEIIFSDRACMSYDKIRSYLDLLLEKAGKAGENVNIWTDAIDTKNIKAIEHSQMAGLQIADAVASSTYYAINRNLYGETESGYLAHLASKLYRFNGKSMSYGIKLLPASIEDIKIKAPEVENLRSFC